MPVVSMGLSSIHCWYSRRRGGLRESACSIGRGSWLAVEAFVRQDPRATEKTPLRLAREDSRIG